MKMAVKVETQEEFDKWIKGQGSYYQTIRPAAPAIAVVEDTKAEEKKEEKK
jgi:heme/copper-type cytochrome/quinol oxidase subunit 2